MSKLTHLDFQTIKQWSNGFYIQAIQLINLTNTWWCSGKHVALNKYVLVFNDSSDNLNCQHPPTKSFCWQISATNLMSSSCYAKTTRVIMFTTAAGEQNITIQQLQTDSLTINTQLKQHAQLKFLITFINEYCLDFINAILGSLSTSLVMLDHPLCVRGKKNQCKTFTLSESDHLRFHVV